MKVRLRPVVASDLPVHFEHQADPESAALAAVPSRDRDAFDTHWARILADPAVVVLTIEADGEVAGSALSFVRDGRRQVGYRIGREHWGRGVATAALTELVARHVTDRPLFARVAAHNPASRRVLEKCGFRLVAREPDGDLEMLLLRLD